MSGLSVGTFRGPHTIGGWRRSWCGGHVAQRFAAEGYDVALVSRGAAELAEPLERGGATAVWDALDVTDVVALTRAVTSYGERFGRMAADEPWHEAASLGVQKAGLRNLVLSLDRALAPHGIRAVSVTVRGTLGTEGRFTPAKVAEATYAAAHQPVSSWEPEVPFTGDPADPVTAD